MVNANVEGFNARRRQHRSIRLGEDVEVRRSPQAVACRKRYAVELGKPQRVPVVGTAREWYTVIEAMNGETLKQTRPEPALLWENHEPGGSGNTFTGLNSLCSWGVLSGIVLGGWESQPHGEVSDGSTQPAKETYAGHVGADQHKQTSLAGNNNWIL